MEKEMLLEFKDIVKEFPGVKALDHVSMSFTKGEVVALLGENGAGKSTLMKILSGAYNRDGGEIILDGKSLPKQYGTMEAREFGVAIIYQELSLLSEMSVGENIYLTHEPLRAKFGKFVDYKKMFELSKQQLEKLHAQHIDVKGKVKNLSLPEKQIVEIAKALAVDCKILIMDEPTTSLTWEETEKMFAVIDMLKKRGITIIYISHRLDEIFQICNRAIVMRDGRMIGDAEIATSTKDDVISMMSGKVLTVSHINRKPLDKQIAKPLLELKNMCDGGFIKNLNLTIYENEVLGIGGLVGSKRTELFRMVFGVDKMEKGTMLMNGKEITIHNAKQAIVNGIGYLSENRKEDGLSLGLSIEENTIHCDMKSMSWFGLIDWKKVRKFSDEYVKKLKTKGKSPNLVVNLSGGNQQKVAIAKWLHADCKILVFDEPTRGIDVNAKAEIHEFIREFAKAQGKAAVVISSEVNELMAVSDRIIVMSKGEITNELQGEAIEQNNVLKCITTKGR